MPPFSRLQAAPRSGRIPPGGLAQGDRSCDKTWNPVPPRLPPGQNATPSDATTPPLLTLRPPPVTNRASVST